MRTASERRVETDAGAKHVTPRVWQLAADT